ncbi:hypothetical protein PTSG_04165 [Salpingoeca rosetta]|uniref:Uncharacterized protein n=1 Tax=Salpingoeca rosetta (strain ATCC 50818 / BSB-021) TaxID=946362 RepID=F2U6S8_SALR5|nr:uncharacterized protein PTSG_04165 [Salpingoeca rosetta]EGD83560.1 hypothetical protein PTSG_04165 [Salpingoeca rosetta]|eukprot:XP_004995064.1 hypothetical protein PTSG_04165 [Salpingoeca rosetta]
MDHATASAVAGGAAGAISRFVVTPFDVVKIRLQLQVEEVSHSSLGRYRSLQHCVRDMYKHEGMASFWKGHTASQLLSISYAAVQFPVFEGVRDMLTTEQQRLSKEGDVRANFVAGSAAATVATVCTYPLDIVRTRMVSQGEPKVYRHVLHSLTSMIQHEGIGSLYRGLAPTLVAVIPYIGTSFSVYIGAKRALAALSHDGQRNISSTFEKALAGAISGVVSKTLVHPIDIVKKRFQVMDFGHARDKFGFGATVRYESSWHGLVSILRQEGVRGLFKGLTPSLVKAVPSSIITFLVYDSLRQLLIHSEL